MNVELRFFATFRQAVGRKVVEREFPEGTTIGEVLYELEEEYDDLSGQLIEDGELRPHINVLKSGREALHLDGMETVLEDGDRLSIFPPVAGG
ncbi:MULTISPECIES: ubiquitin-like small modifier protein 1 [Halolamina]|uniref:Molybdopterin synthase sulfur carrier subunit n=1 Tax=Halolamina pelagica TaxID=699431 RepID=A0A1I5NVN1_9EURY|nr:MULTISPECIES: ubiquitin-like small modifier protein 1 [Halolamina]NHX36481.1 MoaD/ThiS family protein [Halolamina sp. R1-12]SFP25356.1 molybdopterin synthase sulfur carrier subunit [Halolamina pelagica]